MAHNDFLKLPSGVWANGDVPDGPAFTLLDQQLQAAVNGDAGGEWAPAAPIDVDGAGLRARLRYDLVSEGVDADATYSVSTTRLLIVRPLLLTANRTYVVDDFNALEGDVFEVAVQGVGDDFYANIKLGSALGSTVIRIGNGTGADAKYARFVNRGFTWRLLNEKPRNRIVATYTVAIAGAITGLVGAPTTLATLAIGEYQSGDVFILNAAGRLEQAATSAPVNAFYLKALFAGTNGPFRFFHSISELSPQPAALPFGFVEHQVALAPGAAGNLTIQGARDNGNSTVTLAGIASIQHIRP